MKSRTVRGQGVDLAVHEQGDPANPGLLLLHGYPDTHAVWDEVAALLRDRFHVITYDVRGAGASSRPFGTKAYAFEHLMADLEAVLDAVRPGERVHLAGHDWGSIQAWEAACTLEERFLSFTSISGPCLDHAGHWMRARVRRPGPRNLRLAAAQGVRSWYIYAFQTPLLPELFWRSGGARAFTRILRRTEGVEPAAARTLARDGAAGVGLYRANMRQRLLRPRERGTGLPTQVIVPTRDRFVSPHLVGGLQDRAPDLRIRRIEAGHWVPRTHPAVIARWIGEHATDAAGGELADPERRALRRARVSPERLPFEGHLVVVTGAGSGIGRATSLAFAEQGAQVVAADLDLPAAERTAELASLLGPAAVPWRVDVSDAEAMAAFAKGIEHDLGVPDIVVNNAGIGMSGAFLDHEPEDWRKVLDVNLWGVVHGSRLFGRMMVERGEGGHIVNTASAAAYTPSRALPAYSTSKAAVLMLSECLRAELAEHGIGVSAICPGIVNTGITRSSRFVGVSAEEQDRRRDRTARAYGRRGFGPEGVARAILAAVRDDRAVVPVTPEAKAGYLASRFAPAVLRRLARFDIAP